MYSLVQHFVVRNVTSMLNLEAVSGITGTRDEEQRWSYMSDNVLVLSRSDGGLAERSIRVIKTRNSNHDPAAHGMTIRADGVHIL
jgi:KaiC/GvpD/RAD55 family RecA-like ATPase